MRTSMFAIVMIFVALMTGCATTPHPLESGVKTQTAEPIFIEHGGKTVCLYFGDNSGHNVDWRSAIEVKLQSKGLTVVSNPSQADYIADCRVTYLGYAKDYPDQQTLGRILGTGTGAVAGAAIGHGDVGRQVVLGSAFGLAGYLIGQQIDKANTPDLYFGQLHVLIKQRLTFLGDQADTRPITTTNKETVTVTKGGKTTTEVVEKVKERSETPIETSVSTGQSGQANFKTTTAQKVSDFEFHQTTFSGVAKVLKTGPDAAIDELGAYLADAVANIF